MSVIGAECDGDDRPGVAREAALECEGLEVPELESAPRYCKVTGALAERDGVDCRHGLALGRNIAQKRRTVGVIEAWRRKGGSRVNEEVGSLGTDAGSEMVPYQSFHYYQRVLGHVRCGSTVGSECWRLR